MESPDAYTTPALLQYAGTTEIVLTGGDVVTGHDPATGKELWRADGLNPTNDANYRIVASPVTFDDLIIAPTRERPMLVLKAGGRGDVTKSHLLWTFDSGPDVPTPVTDGTYVYVVNDRGIMYLPRGEDRQGDLRPAAPAPGHLQRIAGARRRHASTSPTKTASRASSRRDRSSRSSSENEFDDYTLSSPAVSGGQIYFRTTKYLWAIGSQP